MAIAHGKVHRHVTGAEVLKNKILMKLEQVDHRNSLSQIEQDHRHNADGKARPLLD